MNGHTKEVNQQGDHPQVSQRLEALAKVELFADVWTYHDVMMSFVELLEPCVFEVGEDLLEENNVGNDMFFVLEGTVGIYKSTINGEKFPVVQLSSDKHPFFGEGAILADEPRSATVRAETRCVCLRLTRQAFDDFAQKHPAWAYPVVKRIAQAVLRRLRQANEDFVLLYAALIQEIEQEILP